MKKKTVAGASIYCVIILALAAAFVVLPIRNILLGVYSEYLQRLSITEGIKEIAIVYLFGVILIFAINSKLLRSVCLLLISLLFMQNHQFLIPYLVAIVYIEMIISIGSSVKKICKFRIENEYLDYLSSFVLGVAVWGVAAIVFSLLGKGNFICLRIITVSLFVISLIVYRRKPLFVYIASNFGTKERIEQILIYFLAVLVLIQSAKSCGTVDYDSLWYGLNAENVLIGENSFYDNLGMLTWVHYFPKFFELFVAPVSNLGEYSFIHAVNVVLYELLILTVYKFISELKISNIKALFFTIMVATVPTIANMSTTAKADIFTSFFVVFAAVCFFEAAKKNDFYNLSMAYVAIILAACAKISTYPYIAILFLSGTITFTCTQGKACLNVIFQKRNIPCLLFLGFSIVVFWGTHYRTYLLTGYPLYPFTVNLWKKMGFDGIYPFADYFGGRKAGFADGVVFNLKFYLKHIYNLIFDPSSIKEYRINHITPNWYSNFGIFLSVILFLDLVSKKIKHIRVSWTKDFKIATGILLPVWIGMILISVFLFQYAQDGNYYIVPVSLGIIYCLYAFEQRDIQYKKMYYGIFFAFAVLQFSIMFVTHISWYLGTSSMKFNLLNSSFDSYKKDIMVLEDNGIRDFEEYIVWQSYSNSRALGDGNEQVLFRLSTGFECVNNAISMTKGIFDSEEHLIKYLDWANINFLILPKENIDLTDAPEQYQIYINVFTHLQNMENVFELDAEDYILLDVTSYTDSLNERKEGYKAGVD